MLKATVALHARRAAADTGAAPASLLDEARVLCDPAQTAYTIGDVVVTGVHESGPASDHHVFQAITLRAASTLRGHLAYRGAALERLMLFTVRILAARPSAYRRRQRAYRQVRARAGERARMRCSYGSTATTTCSQSRANDAGSCCSSIRRRGASCRPWSGTGMHPAMCTSRCTRDVKRASDASPLYRPIWGGGRAPELQAEHGVAVHVADRSSNVRVFVGTLVRAGEVVALDQVCIRAPDRD